MAHVWTICERTGRKRPQQVGVFTSLEGALESAKRTKASGAVLEDNSKGFQRDCLGEKGTIYKIQLQIGGTQTVSFEKSIAK